MELEQSVVKYLRHRHAGPGHAVDGGSSMETQVCETRVHTALSLTVVMYVYSGEMGCTAGCVETEL